MTTGCHSMSDPVTTPRDHTFWPHALITPTSQNFKPFISFWAKIENCKRTVMLKIVASGCDQYVRPVGARWVCRLANRPGIPGIVPEIVLLSRRPGNLPNVPGSLANWLRFQAPVLEYDIHTRNATALGERRQRHAVLRNLQNFQLT